MGSAILPEIIAVGITALLAVFAYFYQKLESNKKAKVEEMIAAIKENGDETRNLAEKFDARVDEVDLRLTALETRFDGLDKRFDAFEERNDKEHKELKERLATVEENVKADIRTCFSREDKKK